jgi:hypothetical protein
MAVCSSDPYAIGTQGDGSKPKNKGLFLAVVELLRKVVRGRTPLRGCLGGRRFTRMHVT